MDFRVHLGPHNRTDVSAAGDAVLCGMPLHTIVAPNATQAYTARGQAFSFQRASEPVVFLRVEGRA